jgi:hypothetical protein
MCPYPQAILLLCVLSSHTTVAHTDIERSCVTLSREDPAPPIGAISRHYPVMTLPLLLVYYPAPRQQLYKKDII